MQDLKQRASKQMGSKKLVQSYEKCLEVNNEYGGEVKKVSKKKPVFTSIFFYNQTYFNYEYYVIVRENISE